MARLRYNNVSGTLGASLTSTGTSVTFAAALSGVATVASPDYMVLTIEPGTVNEEIVYLTAYTSGATTGTITRAQEGSSGVAHSNGAAFVHAPTVLDFMVDSTDSVSASGTAFTVPAVSTATLTALTLTGNCTFTFPTASAGESFTLVLTQDATGSRTVTWPAAVKWAGGSMPVLTTTASKSDVLAFLCADGTNWLGFVSGQNF